MSFILNALRKSELERDANQPESLESRILQTSFEKQKKTSIWMVFLVFVNVFFLLFFIWSFTKEDKTEDLEKTSQLPIASKTNQEKVVKDPVQLPIVKVETDIQSTINIEKKLQPVQNIQDNFKPLVKPLVKPSKQIDEQITEIAAINQKNVDISQNLTINTAKKTDQNSNVEKINKQQVKVKPVITQLNTQQQKVKPVAKQSIELEQKTPEPQLEVPVFNTTQAPQKIAPEPEDYPFLEELSQQFRRSVPTFDINVYVYSEIKQNRFIMIKMRKYVAGEQMDMGMKLKEIRINSLVVEYQNKIFQIKRR